MQTHISQNVMRRVYLIHALRPFVSGTALAVAVFAVALWGIGREVWVAHVIENMPNMADVAAVTRFFAAAFLNTDVIVQMLILLAGAALAYALADMLRAFGTVRRFA